MIEYKGPIFPPQFDNKDDSVNGLTKREYLAALAMNGILSDQRHLTPNQTVDIAKYSVDLADALIEQLNK